MLKDGCNRTINYLRVSLTDKCNLRCKYCVPSGGIELMDHKEILTLEEMLRLIDILTKLGITKVRFTGGEPLVRKNAISLIQKVSKLDNAPKIALTTNGVLLDDYIEYLAFSNVRDINISLDTLDPAVYESLTGADELSSVMRSIQSCLVNGINLKLNVVPIKGINEDDIPFIAALARDYEVAVRFIELMPMGCASSYEGLSNDEVRKKLFDVYGEEISCESEGDGPASYVKYKGFRSKVGFISPMSHAFCESCNRLRLTCDGKLKLCLASPLSLDLKALLRSEATDEDISNAIREAVLKKPSHHEFNNEGYKPDDRNMIGIGG